MAFKIPAKIYRLFECVQAYLAGLACLNMCFNLPAGRSVQLPVDILGKLFEQLHAVLVGVVRISPFHNMFSMLP